MGDNFFGFKYLKFFFVHGLGVTKTLGQGLIAFRTVLALLYELEAFKYFFLSILLVEK